ncbi:MAG: hypoxanthine phosphoribosyltransferase [Planctomycetes bacterium]|nr:hypoxanthine phosphoribosyltransferase [Planctomycetota bacterium]
MHRDIDRILITADQLADRVGALALEITKRYQACEQPLVIVTVLSGAVVFLADLIRQLPIRMRLSLLSVSSYPGPTRESQGAKLRGTFELDCDLEGMPVLIVDDILDSGGTLKLVQRTIRSRGPQSMETAVLLRKPGRAPADLKVEYVGFDIPDEFVVGYGLDYDGQYRNLPHIAALKSAGYAGSSTAPTATVSGEGGHGVSYIDAE